MSKQWVIFVKYQCTSDVPTHTGNHVKISHGCWKYVFYLFRFQWLKVWEIVKKCEREKEEKNLRESERCWSPIGVVCLHSCAYVDGGLCITITHFMFVCTILPITCVDGGVRMVWKSGDWGPKISTLEDLADRYACHCYWAVATVTWAKKWAVGLGP